MSILRQFLIGASVAIFPIVYLGMAYNKLSCEQISKMKVKYATLVMVLPFMYGLMYVILSRALKGVVKDRRIHLLLLGAIAGELYSLMGHFGLHIPETLLLSKYPNSVHIIAPIMYALIYGIYVFEVEKLI